MSHETVDLSQIGSHTRPRMVWTQGRGPLHVSRCSNRRASRPETERGASGRGTLGCDAVPVCAGRLDFVAGRVEAVMPSRVASSMMVMHSQVTLG